MVTPITHVVICHGHLQAVIACAYRRCLYRCVYRLTVVIDQQTLFNNVERLQQRRKAIGGTHVPAGAAESPSLPAIARLIHCHPAPSGLRAFAGGVPQCNCGASDCPGHRGCGTKDLHSQTLFPSPGYLTLCGRSKASYAGARIPLKVSLLSHLSRSGSDMRSGMQLTANVCYFLSVRRVLSPQGDVMPGPSDCYLGSSETVLRLIRRPKVHRHR